MAVVLIGSTGNGKSTLGNYLVDPSKSHRKTPTFSTAKDNKPHTQQVQLTQVDVRTGSDGPSMTLTIVDTPGLNESTDKDLEHMIDVIQKLTEVGEIQACLFVVKFNTKIDTQYRETVEYYSKLLPTLFERNTAIVMTEFARDDRSVAIREEQGIDVEKVKTNTVQEIAACGGLRYNPTLFALDSVPYGESEVEVNETVRLALLQYISSLKPVELASQNVAKPPKIKIEDDAKIRELEGQIKGYNKRLKQVKRNSERALDEVEENEKALIDNEKELSNMQDTVQQMDRMDLVTIENWSVNKEWKLLRTLEEQVHIHTNYRIDKVDKWASDECRIKWKKYHQKHNEIDALVTGKFCCGLYVTLIAQTTRRERHKVDIEILKANIEISKNKKQNYEKDRKKIKEKHSQYSEEIEELEKFIEKHKADIVKLSANTMTMEEAVQRRQTRALH